MKRNSNHFLKILILLNFLLALVFHTKIEMPSIEVSKQDSAFNFNRQLLRILSIGNKRLISDLFWIKTLIEADLEKYQIQDKNSWMFHRFRTISELDPYFYQNYLWGGMFLSIIKDDLEGAEELYDIGLKYFPDDYNLNFNAGFNSYFEMGKFRKGVYYFSKISNYPEATELVRLILNKLNFELNQDHATAIRFLRERYDAISDPRIKNKILGDIKLLQLELDLDCLNKKQNFNCPRIDPFGHKYIFNLKTKNWESVEKSRYKIYRKSN